MKLINITDITGYLYCPRKIYLKLVKGIREKPNKKMILGMIKHRIFDAFNKSEEAIVSSIKEKIKEKEIIEIYEENLKKIIEETMNSYSALAGKFEIKKEDVEEKVGEKIKKEIILRVNAVKKFIDAGFLGKQLWENLKPKYLTEFEILSDEIGLKGRVDRIQIGNEIIPYELKSRENIYDSDKLQLAAYALLLEKEFGKKIEMGIVEAAKNNEEILISEELKNKVLEIADKIRNMQDAEITSNFAKCQNCGLREECFQ